MLKWVVAALVVSVLVNLFTRLRRQGDHTHSSVVAQIHSMLTKLWQCFFYQAPSDKCILDAFYQLTGKGRVFRAIPTSVRLVAMLHSCGLCRLTGSVLACTGLLQLADMTFVTKRRLTWH